MTTEHTLRMLGDNVTLMRCAWLELLDELRPDSTLASRIRAMLGIPDCKLATHCGREFPIGPDEIPAPGQPGVMLDDGTVVDLACADHIQRLVDRPLLPAARDRDQQQRPQWCSTCGYQACCGALRCPRPTTATEIAPGIYKLGDKFAVYAVPSASTDRIHQVTVNTRTGAMRCDGPHCDGRICSHQRRVLKARAGF
jgi:hypothetical protein